MAKQTKPTEPVVETKQAEPRVSGSKIVKFMSNGTAPTLRQKGKVYEVPADTAQCLVDKGYGRVVNA
jgi:hypothetical protein